MATDKNEQIRQRAYEIWENEGRPDGAADRHYAQATDEFMGEDEHETLQDLIDEDDRDDDRRSNDLMNSTHASPDVEITTGEASPSRTVRGTEGP
ncbi:Protein of unknown function [Rhizobium sp. NFR07]|uniref:DUF2934 domain-containing protein n=1 Tax=Rhizobium sp. NFR07 TaxID=1566262 RepID=UPI0008E83FCF|nr:DUF2934 domain-containing protein [Rhizobium sp. NFR07]SFB59681.1 Protein of unknown function [Rhizobium sp. NFR07]